MHMSRWLAALLLTLTCAASAQHVRSAIEPYHIAFATPAIHLQDAANDVFRARLWQKYLEYLKECAPEGSYANAQQRYQVFILHGLEEEYLDVLVHELALKTCLDFINDEERREQKKNLKVPQAAAVVESLDPVISKAREMLRESFPEQTQDDAFGEKFDSFLAELRRSAYEIESQFLKKPLDPADAQGLLQDFEVLLKAANDRFEQSLDHYTDLIKGTETGPPAATGSGLPYISDAIIQMMYPNGGTAPGNNLEAQASEMLFILTAAISEATLDPNWDSGLKLTQPGDELVALQERRDAMEAELSKKRVNESRQQALDQAEQQMRELGIDPSSITFLPSEDMVITPDAR